MAGKQNHLQQFGLPVGPGFNHIENPFERHAAYMAQEVTPYCKGCGKQILSAHQDETGATVDSEAEQKRQMCTPCYAERMEVLRKLQQEQAAKAEPQIDWDEYKKQFTRE